ncbi:unnamed protein product [Pieris brassicae]|uniref:Uncharacterized protein n=1 Tax=Pieris brassicae TaxID=7116 RepID=A0A9P0TUI5_PIEBR|nr:unnamed protein product [Pieris brassicae]
MANSVVKQRFHLTGGTAMTYTFTDGGHLVDRRGRARADTYPKNWHTPIITAPLHENYFLIKYKKRIVYGIIGLRALCNNEVTVRAGARRVRGAQVNDVPRLGPSSPLVEPVPEQVA